MGSTHDHPSQSFQPLDWLCLYALVLGEQRVTASTHPRDTRLGWHNSNSVISALMLPVNWLTQNTHIKGHRRLFKTTVTLSLGSTEQFMSDASLPCPAIHVSTAKSPPDFKIRLQRLDEAQGRRNSLHLKSRTEELTLSLCWVPTLLPPRKSKQWGEKKHTRWDFWPSGSLPSDFLLEGHWSSVEPPLEMYQRIGNRGLKLKFLDTPSHQKSKPSTVPLSEYSPARLRQEISSAPPHT